jgi:hypothetical protein
MRQKPGFSGVVSLGSHGWRGSMDDGMAFVPSVPGLAPGAFMRERGKDLWGRHTNGSIRLAAQDCMTCPQVQETGTVPALGTVPKKDENRDHLDPAFANRR